jgi:alkaline phosphatase
MKKNVIKFVTAILILLFVCIASAQEVPRNIIFFIGDGTGISHISAAKLMKLKLNLDRIKTIGLLTTYAYGDDFITDSAAGGTALATGNKTRNGMISQDPWGNPLETILEFAEKKGKSTGIVVTSRVTHATPGCFVAHTNSRENEAEIAEQIAQKDVEVIFGGGYDYFIPKSDRITKSNRKDEKNLILEMKSKGYNLIRTKEELDTLKIHSNAKVLGLFAVESMPPVKKGRKPSLDFMTEKAIEILSKNQSGFFLMVEGSQIDWEAHDSNSDGIISETIDFDSAIGKALDFAEKDKNTVVIVTADHETSGYAIVGGELGKKIKGGFITQYHTGEMVPIFSFGVGEEIFRGINDNTFVGLTLKKFIGNSKP